MKVDRERFLDEGYLIIRQCIPSVELEGLRRSYETLVDRQRAIWAAERKSGDPPGGVWDDVETAQGESGCPRLVGPGDGERC